MGEGDCIVEKPAVAPYCRSGLTNPVGRNGRRRYRWYSERSQMAAKVYRE
jgi:hypothetical protein